MNKMCLVTILLPDLNARSTNKFFPQLEPVLTACNMYLVSSTLETFIRTFTSLSWPLLFVT